MSHIVPDLSAYKPARLSVNLAAVRENYRIIYHKIMPDSRIGAVVKADCYGLGMHMIVPELISEGCQEFFVATLDEALDLRAAAPGVKIFVLNGLVKGYEALYPEYGLIPVLNAVEEIERYTPLIAKTSKTLPAALHFDTGMNRLGMDGADAQFLQDSPELLAALDLRLVMSHFACADEIGNDLNKKQYDQFLKLTAPYPKTQRSLANSSGVFLERAYHFDMVRPGMALYGLNPTPGEKNPMKPVVSARAPILQIKTAKQGDTAGYGASYQFPADTTIAIVALGYGDGVLRSISNRGAFYWKGYRCHIRGRISMDLVTVELSELPEHERPVVGDFMELIGQNQSVENLAQDCDTLGYEIICALGTRYRWVYETSPPKP